MFVYLVNPGIPSIEFFSKKFLKSDNYLKMDDKEKKEYYLCEICNIMINNSDDIEHCEKCDICVKGYDHHCYWTGKCITKKIFGSFFASHLELWLIFYGILQLLYIGLLLKLVK